MAELTTLRNADRNLLAAAENEALEPVKRCFEDLANCANVAATDDKGKTALHIAAEHGRLGVVEYLVNEKNAPIDARDTDSWTPLHFAAHQGRLNVVEFLVNRRADKKARDDDGLTPLHCAAHQGHLDVIEFLIIQEANKDTRSNNGWTPLHCAAHQGHLDVVKFLVNQGADMDARDDDGCTPLQYAAELGNLNVVEFLVSKGADIDARDDSGWTPLQYAAEFDNLNVVEFLVSQGADIDARDDGGCTPLYGAARAGHLNVVELLLRQGADTTITTSIGQTARDAAVSWTRESTIRLFDDPPIVDREPAVTKDKAYFRRHPSTPNADRQAICKKFDTFVLYFWGSKTKEYPGSVFDLIYEGWRLDSEKAQMKLTSEKDENKLPSRWIHLPANNIKWILDLLECLCYMDGKNQRYCTELKAFVQSTLYERRGDNRDACFRQPLFLRQHHRVSMAVPYFDMESKDAYDSRKKGKGKNADLERAYKDASELHVAQTLDRSYHLGLKSTEGRDDDQVVLRYTTQRREEWKAKAKQRGFAQDKAEDGGTTGLNVGLQKLKKPEGDNDQDNGQSKTKEPSPSYDVDSTQLQENTSHTQQTEVSGVMQDGIGPVDAQGPTAHREYAFKRRKSQYDPKDRVEPTAQTTREQAAADKGPVATMLMVHQLWLWKIDERTIITAFPNREHRGDDSVERTLQASLKRGFNEMQECSPDHLIVLNILRCISFFDIPAKAGLQEPAFGIFAASIADLSEKVMNLHKEFFKSYVNKKKHPPFSMKAKQSAFEK